MVECGTHQGEGRINGYLKFFIESDHWNWGPTIWNLTESERNSITGTIEENEYFMKLLYLNFADDWYLADLKIFQNRIFFKLNVFSCLFLGAVVQTVGDIYI